LVGDALNVVGSAIGFNVKKLLNLLAKGKFSHALTKISIITLPKLTIKQIWQNFSQARPDLRKKKSRLAKILNQKIPFSGMTT
jgi:hypothetical protein